SCKDLSQTKLVRSAIFLVRLVPRRPENQRQRAVPPNDVEIVCRKILFSPVARRNDDSLMLADHLLEVFDCFERHVVLRIAKIHERARVNAMIRNHDLDRAGRIASRNGSMFAASRERETQSTESDGYFMNCAGAPWKLAVRWKPPVGRPCTTGHIAVSC